MRRINPGEYTVGEEPENGMCFKTGLYFLKGYDYPEKKEVSNVGEVWG